MKTIKQLSNKLLSQLPLWGLGGLLLLSSCTRVDLEDPLKGKITLVTDWSKRTAGVEIPASYSVVIAGQTMDCTHASNCLPELDAGTYPILIHHACDKLSISGTTATVASNNNQVEPLPGWLFTATAQAVYADFKEETIRAEMIQQVRQLTISLTVTEGDPERIASTTATLSGIANSVDFKANIHTGTNLYLIPTFTRIGNKLTAIVRLLGVTSEAQKLTLDIVFTDGRTQSIESDVSSFFADFNTNKHLPLNISANLNTPIDPDFSATINDWNSTPGGSAIAD